MFSCENNIHKYKPETAFNSIENNKAEKNIFNVDLRNSKQKALDESKK